MPSQSGSLAGDIASVSSTTVGYNPTHTAVDIFVSDGSRARPRPPSSNANQLPNELSIVRNRKSLNVERANLLKL